MSNALVSNVSSEQIVMSGGETPPPIKLRVLHVVDSLEVGGLERLVHDMATGRGAASTSVACLVSVGPFGEMLRNRGISVELIGTKGGFLPTVWRLRTHLNRIRPDAIHCHNLFALLNGTLSAWLAGGIPVIMTKHGIGVPGKGIGGRLIRFLVGRADVVGVSSEAVQILNTWIPKGTRPVRYIANGIAAGPYNGLPPREGARAALGLPVDSSIVGIVARVTGQKGHLLLVDVFARVVREFKTAVLLIVGDGPGLPAVKARIRELGIEKCALVLGVRQDVPMLLAAMDVFCLPSETEGMPMTVLEAMAAGLPVLASNVGGIPEIVEDGRTGFLVPPRQSDRLEAALFELLRDSDRARAMGQSGKKKMLSEFTIEQTITAYEALYRESLKSRDERRADSSSNC